MIIDVTCPTDDHPICEFKFGMNIKKIVNEHMAKCHPTWIKVGPYDYIPHDAPHCPICKIGFTAIHHIDRHVTRVHPEYVKVGVRTYELRDDAESGIASAPKRSRSKSA